ncbi:uncharacterized protein LOC106162633 [Lingula anatina]|uniref:Uncharacterized protein LOC106162633 n=1 Tax=Lingula anatina TaxID=7574 RepID=A0A1S3IDB4_LINAN|nr:uncharacterized protein LOC106162633 [Lingula anatina]|eukprot:XP_013395429.1 uncharacterized protein LOC106162633 [Lingula anatina]
MFSNALFLAMILAVALAKKKSPKHPHVSPFPDGPAVRCLTVPDQIEYRMDVIYQETDTISFQAEYHVAVDVRNSKVCTLVTKVEDGVTTILTTVINYNTGNTTVIDEDGLCTYSANEPGADLRDDWLCIPDTAVCGDAVDIGRIVGPKPGPGPRPRPNSVECVDAEENMAYSANRTYYVRQPGGFLVMDTMFGYLNDTSNSTHTVTSSRVFHDYRWPISDPSMCMVPAGCTSAESKSSTTLYFQKTVIDNARFARKMPWKKQF